MHCARHDRQRHSGIAAATSGNVLPVIRYLQSADIPHVERLAASAGVAADTEHGDQVVLVLDAASEGHLAAVCIVRLEHCHGHVSALIVDPRHDHHAIEHRMLSVAEALCEALGVHYTDIGAARAA